MTQREAVQKMVTELATAVDEGDMGAIAERIDHDFQDGSRDRKAFLATLMQRLQAVRIDEARVGDFEIQITKKGEARVSFRATCDVQHVSSGQQRPKVVSYWTLYCVHRDDGWKLFRFERGEVDYLGQKYNLIGDGDWPALGR